MASLRSILSVVRAFRSADARSLIESGLFDAAWYRKRYPAARRGLVSHYLASGAAEGHWPNPLFDPVWYATAYPEAVADGTLPILSYLRDGLATDRRPNPVFDTRWYLERYPDVRDYRFHPLVHYLRHGVEDGRDPSPDFSTLWYLEQNPDVRNAGEHPLVHYLHFGMHEGRAPRPASPGDRAAVHRTEPLTRLEAMVRRAQAGETEPADRADPVFRSLAEAVAAIRLRDPDARFVDATYPDHVLPGLVPDAVLAGPAALLAQEGPLGFYAAFRQQGGRQPIFVGGLPRRPPPHEWVYVGACDALPPRLGPALAARSFLVRDEPDRIAQVAARAPAEIDSLDLGPPDAEGLGVAALLAPGRRAALTEPVGTAELPNLDRILLLPDHAVSTPGEVETAGDFSWIWCGPDRIQRFALGRRPFPRTTIGIAFRAADVGIGSRCRDLLRFQVNGRTVEAVVAVSGRDGAALIAVPPAGPAGPLTLSIGCRDGVRAPGDPRRLTVHVTAITLTPARPETASQEIAAR
ncbi:hypothetical protein M446_3988 [Methylobacterium sp. 4-46]|uniref:hypothetical protein n=1 Tax=unclassified Methylobacterium TaxID=2615210 RepID=UPI000165C712|nr:MULTISPECIES: hypothetical protein [Methylobacterium]ACA18353.1 hypothetical protein M446_3988 [Methylobacterium sp. 4-46]WFT77650.1 hypothetical protein QA634_20265 [Methylobacterium nodulans]